MKYCKICNCLKLLIDFYIRSDSPDGYRYECKECTKNLRKKKSIENPWKGVLHSIKQRCNNSKNIAYKDYGGRGIECRITEDELKQLWFRDKAYDMDRPSIDRENNDGHYEYINCRFIELKDNVSERNKRVDSKVILQFSKSGNFIREYESVKLASTIMKGNPSNISKCARGSKPTAYGFLWRYKI